ncbi:uncharacterized protein LOC104583825 [Brachypodium distachyon]|uniref:Uncharacterized protein n=1 Tax=Brachypodium distachyon TaxID=15368 RepID=A0A0Q3JBQ6_BRADI|nr:uncharacterized protein LOC104583825 [Brachypodium distachyon]KQK15347.1 hypothetical protein BRADI_1g22073v3 [Brachypodium distachyon]PNT74794.1 hypothetical protein BRADI_1g22073v3 [Brachypodium distachyon]PNT74795.1 hypothetical protein BRADI_1g22073v3 [Brachypodium distachyon]|eukprot:XP_014758280.1 uncharacterized protein LOC104583825 [Brachypodium distachyon]
MMLASATCLKDCKEERLQKLRSLQARAHDLCCFLGITATKQECYQFLVKNSAISVQEVVDVNGLSLEFIKRVEAQISDMEILKSKKMVKIFKMKAAELDEQLKAAPLLKNQKDYLLDFTLDDVEQGRVDFTFAVKKMEELIDKAIESYLRKKLMVHAAVELLQKKPAAEIDEMKVKYERENLQVAEALRGSVV